MWFFYRDQIIIDFYYSILLYFLGISCFNCFNVNFFVVKSHKMTTFFCLLLSGHSAETCRGGWAPPAVYLHRCLADSHPGEMVKVWTEAPGRAFLCSWRPSTFHPWGFVNSCSSCSSGAAKKARWWGGHDEGTWTAPL